MITVPEVVKQIIQQTPFLEDALQHNLINLSSLARYIKPEVEKKTMKDVQEGSIIMALTRLGTKLTPPKELLTVFTAIPDLIVRSNLFEITIANSDTLIEKQKQLLEFASIKHSYFATITHGVFETTIIASQEVKDTISKLYKEEKIIYQLDNLSSITVKFPQDIIDIPGVYYMILKALAWEGIDITEIVSTFSEVTIVLKHDYVDRAFSLIKRLFSKAPLQN